MPRRRRTRTGGLHLLGSTGSKRRRRVSGHTGTGSLGAAAAAAAGGVDAEALANMRANERATGAQYALKEHADAMKPIDIMQGVFKVGSALHVELGPQTQVAPPGVQLPATVALSGATAAALAAYQLCATLNGKFDYSGNLISQTLSKGKEQESWGVGFELPRGGAGAGRPAAVSSSEGHRKQQHRLDKSRAACWRTCSDSWKSCVLNADVALHISIDSPAMALSLVLEYHEAQGAAAHKAPPTGIARNVAHRLNVNIVVMVNITNTPPAVPRVH